MGDLNSALNAAFDEETGSPEPASTPAAVETEAKEPEARETTSGEPEPAAQSADKAPVTEEESGDVLFDKLTPDQIAKLKATPEGRALHRALMQSYTQKMQAISEKARFWEAINNPQTQRQAVEALAKSVGLSIQPSDQPQQAQATKVANQVLEKWGGLVGPEAGPMLYEIVKETVLDTMKGQIEPLQHAAEYVQQDAAARQSEGLYSEFKVAVEKKGWEFTPQIEAKMAEIGRELAPTRMNPVTGKLEVAPFSSREEGLKWMDRIYRIATADSIEQATEKRILERMNKAAQSAEPARGVPSVGREKRSNITKDMDLMQSMDVAFAEELGR